MRKTTIQFSVKVRVLCWTSMFRSEADTGKHIHLWYATTNHPQALANLIPGRDYLHSNADIRLIGATIAGWVPDAFPAEPPFLAPPIGMAPACSAGTNPCHGAPPSSKDIVSAVPGGLCDGARTSLGLARNRGAARVCNKPSGLIAMPRAPRIWTWLLRRIAPTPTQQAILR